MPSDKSTDLYELSRHLHSGKTPPSPRELDERIVQHAREKAEEYAGYSSSVGFKWLGSGWKTAVAVFSVAVIAISTTIQIYDNSRTTPFVASRAIPDAEVTSLESAENVLPTQADGPLQRLEERERQLSAEPANVQETQPRTPPPTRSSNVNADVAFRATERQVQAQVGLTDLQSTGVDPGLGELLSDIDNLGNTAPLDQGTDLANTIERFDVILEAMEDAFGNTPVAIEAYSTLGSPPTIEQLKAKASALVNSYNAIENDQLLARLASSYQQQRQISDRADFPATIELMVDILESWLASQ